jgi:hypothetical protein
MLICAVISIGFAIAVDIVTEKKFNDKNAIIKEQQHLIESYVRKLKKVCPECKDCGVNEYENGYIIDGYYYEFKGNADIQMEEE